MHTLLQRVGVLIAIVALFTGPTAAFADGPKVLNVLAVKVSGDQAAYLAQVKQLNAITERLGAGTIRVWQATAAGTDTGTIYVAIEHADLAAFAQSSTKLEADAEFQAIIKELNTSGLREITGSSLLVDITP